MASNGPSKLERSLSLTSEPRTLTKDQYDLVRTVASMQALEKQRLAAGTNGAETGGAKGKPDPEEEASDAAAAKLPA